MTDLRERGKGRATQNLPGENAGSIPPRFCRGMVCAKAERIAYTARNTRAVEQGNYGSVLTGQTVPTCPLLPGGPPPA